MKREDTHAQTCADGNTGWPDGAVRCCWGRDGVWHRFRASSNWPTADPHVVRRCGSPHRSPRLQAQLLLWRLSLLTDCLSRFPIAEIPSWLEILDYHEATP